MEILRIWRKISAKIMCFVDENLFPRPHIAQTYTVGPTGWLLNQEEISHQLEFNFYIFSGFKLFLIKTFMENIESEVHDIMSYGVLIWKGDFLHLSLWKHIFRWKNIFPQLKRQFISKNGSFINAVKYYCSGALLLYWRNLHRELKQLMNWCALPLAQLFHNYFTCFPILKSFLA